MTIINNPVLDFASRLYQVPKERLGALSQNARSFCMRLLRSFSVSDFEVEKAQSILERLEVKSAKKEGYLWRVCALFLSYIKGVFNFLHFRISSEQLKAQLDASRQTYLEYTTGNQLDRCCVGDPETAEVFFLGSDCPLDPKQGRFQIEMVNRYASDGDYVLIEGHECFKQCPQLPGLEKQVVCAGWDDLESIKKIKVAMKTQLHVNVLFSLNEHVYKKEINKQNDVRHRLLVKAIKALQGKIEKEQSKKKIFVLGGSPIFIDKTRYILDHFQEKSILIVKRQNRAFSPQVKADAFRRIACS